MQLQCPACSSEDLDGLRQDDGSILISCRACPARWLRWPTRVCPECGTSGPWSEADEPTSLSCHSCGALWSSGTKATAFDVRVASSPTTLGEIEELLLSPYVPFPVWLDSLQYARSQGRYDLMEAVTARVLVDLRRNLRLDYFQSQQMARAVVASRLGAGPLSDVVERIPVAAAALDAESDVLGRSAPEVHSDLMEVSDLLPLGTAPALARCARTLRRLSRPDLAVTAGRTALAIDRRNEHALASTLGALNDAGDPQAAILLAAEHDPDRRNAYANRALARALRLQGDGHEALALARDLAVDSDDPIDAQLLLAAARRFHDDAAAEQALALLDRIAPVPGRESGSVMAQVELARRLMREGDLETAEAIVVAALRTSDWFDLHDALAQIRNRMIVRDRRRDSARGGPVPSHSRSTLQS